MHQRYQIRGQVSDIQLERIPNPDPPDSTPQSPGSTLPLPLPVPGRDQGIGPSLPPVRYRAIIDGATYEFSILESGPGELTLLFDDHPVRLHWATAGDKKWFALDGCTYLVERPTRIPARRPGEKSTEALLRAPMPAQVRAVLVTEGEAVEKGQPLLLLEAMKMEMRLSAPRAGVVSKLLVSVGETVQREQVLVEMEE